jgi:hypothetical protein
MKKIFIKISAISVFVLLVGNNSLGLTSEQTSTVQPGAYSTTVSWVTDKPSTSRVEYGNSLPYTDTTIENPDLVIYHKVSISNLIPSTQYSYRVISRDAYGNETVSNNLTFATTQKPPKNQPPQISDIEASTIIGAGPGEPTEKNPQQKNNKQTGAASDNSSQASQLVKKEQPIEKILMDRGGVLLRKGKWQIEPSMTYVHTSANKISIEGYTVLPVLIIGEISTEKVKRDIFIQTLTTRYGLKNNLQVELNVPYRYQHERITVESPASETLRHAAGLGDVSAGIFYQCAYEKGIIPDLVAGISVKSPTGQEPYGQDIGLGTGHWGIKTSLVAVKASDPAILFSSLGYTKNLERNDIEGYGTIEPGDSFDYGLGFAFALNYQVALSFQLSQSVTQKMRVNDNSVASSFTNVVTLKYGLTWSLSKNFSCEVSAGHGLTTDSPDFIFGLSFPYSF